MNAIQRQLEVYEESWKKNHDAVQECWAWEGAASVGLATALLIERATQAWRDRVFRGTEEYSEAANAAHREMFESWRRTTQIALKRLEALAAEFGAVEGAVELQQAEKRVSEHLARWQPPGLSAGVKLREMTLDSKSAEELERLLEQPVQHTVESRPRMTEMPLSDLRRVPKREVLMR